MRLNAIISLYKKDCHQAADGNVFIEGRVPTAAENAAIDAEVVRLTNIQNATQYQRDRAKEYALIHWDDLRFNDMRDGTTTEFDTRAAIKAKYPKPV